MSTMESDGIDEVLQGVTQVALTAAARMGEQLARARQQAARHAQERSEQAARDYASRLHAERAAAHAALAPVHREDWWDGATSQDVARAYETAAAWRGTDAEAERAHARIVDEVRTRFGVELRDEPARAELVGAQDREGADEARRGAARGERVTAFGLLARADAVDRAAEARTNGEELRDNAAVAWDSAERRESLAAELAHVDHQAAIDARLIADVAQACPATDAVRAAPGRMPRAGTQGTRLRGERSAQRTGRSR